MNLTLGLTGMDEQIQARLERLFAAVSPKLRGRWQLAPANAASHVIVDMDSVYGPMSWLSLANAGKQVIGMTSAERSKADFLLRQPVDEPALLALLDAIAEGASTTPMAGGADAGTDVVESDDSTEDAARSTPPTTDESAEQPGEEPASDSTPADFTDTDTTSDPAPVVDAPAATIDPPTPATGTQTESWTDAAALPWYHPEARQGRWLLTSEGQPELLLDHDHGIYHGPATLKPLQELFAALPHNATLRPLGADAWQAHPLATAEAQPLQRLHWYGALLAGAGRLLPGVDPNGQFRLGKWPRTEREFPRHFRIATVMMRGPATVDEIAAAADVDREEVADFINAHIASGHAEAVVAAPPAEPAPARGSGLLSRLRGRGN